MYHSNMHVFVDICKMTHLFIVMEYVETDFKKLMSNPLPISEEHIVTIMYNMFCSLQFIHSADIVHRDLKPANFLIDSNC